MTNEGKQIQWMPSKVNSISEAASRTVLLSPFLIMPDKSLWKDSVNEGARGRRGERAENLWKGKQAHRKLSKTI